MAQQYVYSNKICATCEYWGGCRSFTDCFQKIIVVSSPMDKGPCYCRTSGWATTPRSANGAPCRMYELWKAIRR